MNARSAALLSIVVFFLHAFSGEDIKADLLKELRKRDSLVRENVKSIYTETVSKLNMNDNDYTVVTTTKDFLDSILWTNVMYDNTTSDSFLSKGKFISSSGRIPVDFRGENYTLFAFKENSFLSHDISALIPDSFSLEKRNNKFTIKCNSPYNPLVEMTVSSTDYKAESFSFRSYFGLYNVKIIKHRFFSNYLSLPDSVEVFLGSERVMTSKVREFKVNYR